MSYVGSLWDPTQNDSLASPAQWDLDLPVWAAEVQEARTSNTFVARTLMNTRTWHEQNGVLNRTAQFVLTGKLGSEYHEKGDVISGTKRAQIMYDIHLDERPIRSAVRDEKITRMFEQANTRQGLTTSLGQAHAAHQEIEAMKQIALAARFTNTGNTPAEFLDGGNQYANTTSGWQYDYGFGGTPNATRALNVLLAIRNQVKIWDKQNVPAEGRTCLLPVDIWYEVRDLEKASPSQSGTLAGGIYGNTDLVGPKLPFAQYFGYDTPLEYMGVKIYRHNFFEATYDENITAFSADHSSDRERAGNFSSTCGLLYQAGCAGFVDVMGVSFKMEAVPLTTDEVVYAMSWMGAGIIRPNYAVELVQS